MRNGLRATATTAVLAGVCLAGAAAPAAAAYPAAVDYTRDAGDVAHRLDVRQVIVSAASSEEPAAVSVRVKRALRTGDAFTIWFNFDKDKKPELRVDAGIGSEYLVRRADGWGLHGKDVTSRGCMRPDGSPGSTWFDVSFGPGCYAPKAHSFAATVLVYHGLYDGTMVKRDWAAGYHRWLPRVRSQF